MNLKRPQPTRPTGSPSKPCYSEILTDAGAHVLPFRQAIPTVILTSPTPQSSVERMPPQTLYQPAFQTPPRPLLPYQTPPRRLLGYQTETPPSIPPLRTVPRAAEDVQAMLDAMASGRFDGPVFGGAGATFHEEERRKEGGEGGMQMGKKAASIRKKVKIEKMEEGMGGLQTPTPRPKRKRVTKVKQDDEEGGVQKKARVARKKVKVEEAQQLT